MAMSNEETSVQRTQHAFLVAWGWFAEETGLIQKIQSVALKQKTYTHSPQNKVLEFVVGTLAGMQHLQELSLSAHPLDCDRAVAQAWGQSGWADYSGVSRTLSALSWPEVQAIETVLEEVSQPYLQAELQRLRLSGKRLRIDADLTGLPVSNTSRTYPNAAYGHMDDEIRLGYQAGVVSLISPTYGRMWLSATHHPGDTVSSTQAEALVLEAERRIGQRPKRRTELLGKRIEDLEPHLMQIQERVETQQKAIQHAQERQEEAQKQIQDQQIQVADLEKHYQARRREERPTSQLAMARQRFQMLARRLKRRETARLSANQRLANTQTQWKKELAARASLMERLKRFEQDNDANPDPVEAEFRLDAGFGSYQNVALLAEMGYEVYTKSPSQQLTDSLKRQLNATTTYTRVGANATTTYTRVGANAEMVVWPQRSLTNCPYPFDVALERFYTGSTLKHSTLLHYGSDLVTQDLPAWFNHYNGRQIIEAGIKEGKQVFYLHKIKVRSEPAIYLQECCVLFAANFIRWASHWLAEQAQPVKHALDVRKLGIKRQVQVAAHVSAQVIRNSECRLLKFSSNSAFAGKVLQIPGSCP
jgi:hypothetical protein